MCSIVFTMAWTIPSSAKGTVEQLLASNSDVIYRGGRIMHSILVFHGSDCTELDCIQLNGRNL